MSLLSSSRRSVSKESRLRSWLLSKKRSSPNTRKYSYPLKVESMFNQVSFYSKIYGFIFLFKWIPTDEKRETLTDYDPELFFAK